MFFLKTTLLIMISILIVNVCLHLWMQAKQKGKYKWEVLGHYGNTVTEVLMLSVAPILNLLLSKALVEDTIKLNKSETKEKREKEKREQLRDANPHWNTVDTVGEIVKKYDNHRKKELVYAFIQPMHVTVKENKDKPAMKYLLESYEESLVKLNAILGASENMSIDKKNGLYENGQQLITKFAEEVIRFEKEIDILEKEIEQQTYERMMEEIVQETKRHKNDKSIKEIKMLFESLKNESVG